MSPRQLPKRVIRVRNREIFLRRFFDGETTEIPQFYIDRIKNDLGDFFQYLPEGALEHDPNAYIKKHETKSELVQKG